MKTSTTKDDSVKDHNWHFMWPGDPDHMYDEAGNKWPLTTADFVFEWGQYDGLRLNEVDNVSYLEWMLRSAVEKKDWWQEKMVKMRLKELT